MVAWATKMALAPDRIVHLATAEALQGFLEAAKGVVVVGYFADGERAEIFTSVAEK
jgi:hypothetical protein